MPGVLLVLAGNGWMRGVQRTREPVRIVLVANALSAVASPLLVYPAGLGLHGSAIANVAAQAVGAALFVALAAPHRGVRLRPDRAVMRAQLVVGRDLIVRSAAFQVAFLTAAAVASRMGTAQLARPPDRPAAVGVHRAAAGLVRDRRAVARRRRARRRRPAAARRVAWQVGALGPLRRRRVRRAVRRRVGR